MLEEKADVEDAERRERLRQRYARFSGVELPAKPAFIILLHRSLFNGNNKTPSTSPLIGLFIYNKRDI